MSRSRASAVLVALVSMMAMMMGAATFTSTAASAAPAVSYPPERPKLKVVGAKVKVNKTVRVTGSQYPKGVRVRITVTFPRQGRQRAYTRTYTVTTKRTGRSAGTFGITIKMTGVGRVTINAKTAGISRTVHVTVSKSRGRNWDFRSAVLPIGADTPGSTGPASAKLPADDKGLAIAGFGVLALIGSAVVTRQATRRRRRVYAA